MGSPAGHPLTHQEPHFLTHRKLVPKAIRTLLSADRRGGEGKDWRRGGDGKGWRSRGLGLEGRMRR